MSKIEQLIPVERISSKIFLIRKEKVLLDSDLADLYGVQTKHLIQAVKRNIDRFPEDFMFQLSKEEFKSLEVTDCDLKLGWKKISPICFH